MSRRAVVILAVLAAGSLVAGSASAWEPIYPTRPVWRSAVPYSLNSAGSPDLGGFAGTEVEVRRGMDDWTRVACTSLTVDYRGSSTAVPGVYEGTSVIGWVESGWRHDSSAIGVTGPRWGTGIVEADMEMNGVNYRWVTGSGSYSDVNAYSIILHEGGHYYGLGHTTVRGSTMWPSYSGGIIALAGDDQAGICALYPGSTTDCTTTGCPSGQECVSGSCRAITGDGTVCSPCTSPTQCGGTANLCLGYPDGGGYCGRACSSDADCAGDRCLSTSGGSQCVRFSGSTPSCAAAPSGCTRDSDCAADRMCSGGECVLRPATGNELGAGCSGDDQCRSALCMGGVCSQTCDWLNAGSCPSGFYCDGDVSPSCSTGYCVRGAAGAGALGESCSGDTECSSLFCSGGICSLPCIPGGAVGCAAGYSCQVDTLPCRGACQRARALGDACDGNDQCASGACASRGSDTFCTQLCDAAGCPSGFTCAGAGDQSVCVPDLGGLDWACTSDAECLSGICTLEGGTTYCTRGCDGNGGCPEGYACSDSDTDSGVCVREEGALGQPCASNAECASGLCAVAGADTFCTRPCSPELACPDGFECVPAGDTSLCRSTEPPRPPMTGGCGCVSAADRAPSYLLPVILGAGIVLLSRRRRRR